MSFNPENPHNTSTNSDRFLLLSAYLDGEVTPSERQQVHYWLDTDAEFHQQYRKLLRLQQELHHLPDTVPVSPDLSVQFFRALDRRQQQRQLTVVGSLAIVALAIGLVSQLFLRENSLIPQLAQQIPVTAESDSLVIALNHPPIDIPIAAK
jgi:anti-sigma factor RsiW